MTAIVDYKAGNLTSVALAFAAAGAEARIVRDAESILSADRVVFPGVGAAGSAMANLKALGLEAAVKKAALSGKPFMGICLGMQILFEHSQEDGGVDTLGVFPGTIRRFPAAAGCKIPHMGWNSVEGIGESGAGNKAEGDFYFVHSYYADVISATVGKTEYAGVEFTSAARKGALVAYQFHPEKSGKAGLRLIEEFARC